jgi:hypothetical protein
VGVAIATSTPFGVGGGRFHYSTIEEWVDTVYLGAWRKELFYKIGLFDEELVRNQDDEFNYRLRSVGGKILLSPSIRSKYIVRSNPYSLARQYCQYGFWKIRVLQKHPRQMQRRQFIPFLFVSGLIVSLLMLITSSQIPDHPMLSSLFKLGSVIIPGSYACANILYSLWISSKHKISVFPFLLLIYPILHISYGVGFIFGLVFFINRWDDKMGDVPKLER